VTVAQDIELWRLGGLGERYIAPQRGPGGAPVANDFVHVMINFLMKIYSLRSVLYVVNIHQYNTH